MIIDLTSQHYWLKTIMGFFLFSLGLFSEGALANDLLPSSNPLIGQAYSKGQLGPSTDSSGLSCPTTDSLTSKLISASEDEPKDCYLKNFDGSNVFNRDKLCQCLKEKFWALYDDIPSPNERSQPRDNEKVSRDLDSEDEIYFQKKGERLLNQINSAVESLGILSQLTDSQASLAKVSSCQMKSVVNAMKESIASCPDRESAENIFKLMFAPNLERDFGEDLSSRLNQVQFEDVFTSLEGNILENLKVWSSDSTPARFPNACIPLKKFALMEMMKMNLMDIPKNSNEYEELMREYHERKYNNENYQPRNGKFNQSLSNPLLKIIAEDPQLRGDIESYLSNSLFLSEEVNRFFQYFNDFENSTRSRRMPRGNLNQLVLQNKEFKKLLVDKLLDSTNEKCKKLTKKENYEQIFCIGNNYTPSTKLLVETILPTSLSPEQNLGSESYDNFFSSSSLIGRSCQPSRNIVQPNELSQLLLESNQPISYMDNFKASDPNELGGLQYCRLGDTWEDLRATNPPESVGGRYLDLNSVACSENDLGTEINNKIESMLTYNKFPDALKEKIRLLKRPSSNNKIRYGEMDAYALDVMGAIMGHYSDEFDQFMIDERSNEENGQLSEVLPRHEMMKRWLSEEKGISYRRIIDTLNMDSFEDAATIDNFPYNSSNLIIDYAFNGTPEDKRQLEAIGASESKKNLSSKLSKYAPSAASYLDDLSPRETTRQSYVYTPRGLPQGRVGESFLSLKSYDSEPPISTPVAVTPTEFELKPVPEILLTGFIEEIDERTSPVTDSNPEKIDAVEDQDSFEGFNPGLVLSNQTSRGPASINQIGFNQKIRAEQNATNKYDSETLNNENRRRVFTRDSQGGTSANKRTESVLERLKKMRDELKGSNSEMRRNLDRMIARREKIARNREDQPANPYRNKSPRYPSKNVFDQFSNESLSSDESVSNTEGLEENLEEKIKQAKKEGRFTDKPSAFPSGGGGSAGGSRAPASAGGRVSGGPQGSGIIAGIGGQVFIPSTSEGEEIDSASLESLNQVVPGLVKEEEPHVLAKVIPHALIINNENGVQGLIDVLGLQGRRFTSLDVYFVDEKPSYVVRIYDYDIGNDVVNDNSFRKRLLKTIDVLKRNNEQTKKYMKDYYQDGKFSESNQVLGSISAKLKLMYERPACTNPDYDRSTPCVIPEEINELKKQVLTREEVMKLIEYDSSISLSK